MSYFGGPHVKNYCVLYNPLANNGKAEAAAHALDSVLTDGEVRYVDIASMGSYYDFCEDVERLFYFETSSTS